MSTSTSNSSPSLNAVQQAAMKGYTKGALTRRDQFASDAEWARTFARNFYHSVDSSIGFLPVYHSLLNTLYNTIAEKATTVKAQPSSAKAQPSSAKAQPSSAKAQAKQTPSQDHPLLPTPQNQSESFEVKMEKLFKYAWPLVGEYRSLERWAKVQAAYWQMKGNVGHKIAEVAAKLLEMAKDQQKHTQMIEEMKSPRSNHYAAFLQQHWNTRNNFPTHSAWAKVTAKNIQKQLNTTAVDCATIANGLVLLANMITAPINASASKPSLTFAKDFDGMAQEALPSLHNFTDESAWARATARNFFHQFGATTPFVTIYNKLLHYADLKNAEDEAEEWSSDESEDDDETYETEEDESEDDDDMSLVDEDDSEAEYEDEADDETLSYTSDESEEIADSLFTPAGKATTAEINAGRQAMNRILFKEYREWYNAFKEEADEEDNGDTAEDRFSWHCAKILSQNTGLEREMCQTVVGGWLELNKKTLETV